MLKGKKWMKRLSALVVAAAMVASTSAAASAYSTTTDNVIRVATPNALAVMVEMMGGNVVSSAPATLNTNSNGMGTNMPYFLTTFGTTGNNVNPDPWMVNYKNNGANTPGATNYGWSGLAGWQLKPVSNAGNDAANPSVSAYVNPTYAAALVNHPQLLTNPSVGDTITTQNNGYWGVNEAGFQVANTAMNTGTPLSYYVGTNLSSPARIETTMSEIADKMMDTEAATRYSQTPAEIASSFSDYFDANEQKAIDLTSGLDRVQVIQIVGGSADQWRALRNDIHDIYGTTYINDAGGVNPVGGSTGAASGSRNRLLTDSQINSLASAGPTVITVNNESLYDAVGDDSSISGITHYQVPTGVYLWSVRSPEGALCALWLAKVLHGGETVTYHRISGTVGSFINMYQTTYDFYDTYYHYNTASDATNKLHDIILTRTNYSPAILGYNSTHSNSSNW